MERWWILVGTKKASGVGERERELRLGYVWFSIWELPTSVWRINLFWWHIWIVFFKLIFPNMHLIHPTWFNWAWWGDGERLFHSCSCLTKSRIGSDLKDVSLNFLISIPSLDFIVFQLSHLFLYNFNLLIYFKINMLDI